MSFCDHGRGCLVRGIALPFEDQLASQDGLFWMQLVVKGNQFNDLKHVFKNFIAPPWKFLQDSSGETVHDIWSDTGMKYMNFASSRNVVAKGTNFPHLW